jgi:large subunit ribosomal protein L7/L12
MTMTINADDVVRALGNMTVMELISLTKELEVKWGVEAKPPEVQVQVVQETVQVVAQTEFEVVLVSFPADKKMGMVKLVRELMGTGLLESKTFVESVPKTVKGELSKDDAEALKAKLVEAGAVVEVK